MSKKVVLRILGMLWIGLSCILILYALIAHFYYGRTHTSFSIRLFPLLLLLSAGLACYLSTRKLQVYDISPRSAVISVLLVWFSMVSAGALPYIWEGIAWVDAVFESASGFSTTGATIFSDIESLPATLLIWRSLTQWVGAMGIVVLFVAIFPSLGVSGKRLFSNEMPGPIKESLTPHINETTRKLWIIYLSLTVLLTLILKLLGLSFFDAINHAFTTLATGGFSTKNTSISTFSPTVQWTISLFMLLGGLNFSLYILLLAQKYEIVANDIEVRWYLSFIMGVSVIVTGCLLATTDYSLATASRLAFFTVISLTTTTGYAVTDYEAFALFLQAILFITFFTGGSAGSTSGGMKFYRIVLFFKALAIELKRSISPHSITSLNISGFHVPPTLMSKIFIFMSVYFLSVGIVALIFLGSGMDFLTAFSAAASSVGNVGPAFGEVGPTENYGHFSGFNKLVSAAAMIIGRLEFFAFLTALHPAFWKR